ncbi:hypothetical protein MRBLWH7_003938 [Microbacterium sp. LWH7-1.2]
MRRAELPEHTCGWSPRYRRTVPNDECERCRAEDELIFDTQRFDQRKRSWIYRPARASNAVSAIAITNGDDSTSREAPAELRRETFVPLKGVKE